MNEIPASPAPGPQPPPPAWGAPPPPPAWAVAPPVPTRKQPAVAGVLSLFPGIGHLYLGLNQRAAIFCLIWIALISIVHHTGGSPLGLLIPFWWFFVLIDAVRQAHAINRTGAPDSNLVTFENELRPSGSLGFGVFLVLVGLFFLLDRWVKIDLSLLIDYWMLIPVAFGGWLIWSHFRARRTVAPRADAPDTPTP